MKQTAGVEELAKYYFANRSQKKYVIDLANRADQHSNYNKRNWTNAVLFYSFGIGLGFGVAEGVAYGISGTVSAIFC